MLNVGKQISDLFRQVLLHFGTKQTSMTTSLGLVVDLLMNLLATRPSIVTTSSNLLANALALRAFRADVARLRWAVTRISQIVGKTWCIDETGVDGALVHKVNKVAKREPDPRNDHCNKPGLHVEPCRRLIVLPEGGVDVVYLF
jgi:hypothetical protein